MINDRYSQMEDLVFAAQEVLRLTTIPIVYDSEEFQTLLYGIDIRHSVFHSVAAASLQYASWMMLQQKEYGNNCYGRRMATHLDIFECILIESITISGR